MVPGLTPWAPDWRPFGARNPLPGSPLSRTPPRGDRITLGDLLGPEHRGAVAPAEREQVLIDRQALHAHRLRFQHPLTGIELDLTAPLPEDLERTLQALRTYRAV